MVVAFFVPPRAGGRIKLVCSSWIGLHPPRRARAAPPPGCASRLSPLPPARPTNLMTKVPRAPPYRNKRHVVLVFFNKRPQTKNYYTSADYTTPGAQDPTELRPPGPKAVKRPAAGIAQHTLLVQPHAIIAHFLVQSFAASTSPGAGASERFNGSAGRAGVRAREGGGVGTREHAHPF